MILYAVRLNLRNPDASGERVTSTVYVAEHSRQDAAAEAVELADAWEYMNDAIVERIEALGIIRVPIERGVVFPDELDEVCVGLVLEGNRTVTEAGAPVFAEKLRDATAFQLVPASTGYPYPQKPGDDPESPRSLVGIAFSLALFAVSILMVLGRWEGRW